VSYVFDHLDLIKKVIRRFPCGLITDIDGTISQTVSNPQRAKVSPLCRQYLSKLCHRIALVAAISGRPVDECRHMLKIEEMVYIGNHGLERWSEGHSEFTKDAQSYTGLIKSAINELTPLLPMKCIIIENKGVTASIHYRLCQNPQSAKKNILNAIDNSPHSKSLRIMQGRMIIDIMPLLEITKGTATLDLMREYHLQSCIYMGDDFTDIDAFRAIKKARRNSNFQGFAIGITSHEMPKKLTEEADFTLKGISDVERFLKWFSLTVPEPG
jgi:trehalose 6-phosphate phosphatase